GITAKRCPGRVEPEGSVGTLEEMHRVLLRRHHGGRRPADAGEIPLPRELEPLARKAVVEVQSADVGISPEVLVAPAVQAPVDPGADESDMALAAAKVLHAAEHGVVARGLEG